MRINNNIMAMNAHRQLGINQTNASKSMERLSSGLRINRAGDDAAGLAISEKMRGQIRGLKQAQRNAQDGISLIQTAEGALNETHAILQRMRELAAQAANDTNVVVDRNEIQKEMNQLTSELNRIGNTTEFNTQKLLNGGAAAAVGQVGNFEVDEPSSTGAVGAATMSEDTQSVKEQLGIYSFTIDVLPDDGQTISIGGVEFVFGDGSGGTIVIGSNVDEAADNLRTAITSSTLNTRFAVSGSDAEIVLTERAGEATGTDLDAPTGTASTRFTFNVVAESIQEQLGVFTFSITEAFGEGDVVEIGGVTIAAGSGLAINTDTAITAEAQAAAILIALEADGTFSSQYAVVDNHDGTLTITEKPGEADGSSLDATVTGANPPTPGEYSFDLTANLAAGESITIGSVTLTEGTDFTAGADVEATATAIAAALTEEGTFTASATGSTIQLTEVTPSGNDLTDADITITTASGDGYKAVLQIGANTGQSFTIQIDDMRALALGISTKDNTVAKTVNVDGKDYTVAWTKNMDVTNGTDAQGAEYALDVSTHDNATAAIKVIDDAITTVSAERSKLGAYQNRLEHTISNLGTSAENLQAAESRIRDLDMAEEMMAFTKNSILQQAATAMLAQANMAPQSVLQLLG